jgi:hypothetical protein
MHLGECLRDASVVNILDLRRSRANRMLFCFLPGMTGHQNSPGHDTLKITNPEMNNQQSQLYNCQKMLHFYTLLFSQCVQLKSKFKFRS